MKEKLIKYQLKLNELFEKESYSFDDKLRKKLPANSGIYRIFYKNAIDTETLYLGISKNIKNRVASNHFKGNIGSSTLRKKLSKSYTPDETTKFFSEKCYVQIIEINIDEVHCYEHFFIAMLCPELND